MDNATTSTRMAAAQAAPSSSWTVAVTGSRAGAAVARCLRAAPAFRGRILGFGLDDCESGAYADRIWDGGYTVPDPVAGAGILLESIDRIRQDEPIDAIIPCLDAELPNYIALQPALARRGIRLMLPDRATLYSCNKDYLPTLCAKADIATPRVRRITHEGFFDLNGIDGQFWRYPMVVKGIFCDAYVVHSTAEAKLRFQQVAAAWGYPVLVQEFVEGEEVALAALGDGSGATVDMAMIRKQGRTEVAIDDFDVGAAGRRLMAALKWRGPLEMEMLRDRSGKLHLIGINPRFPAWIGSSVGIGAGLPAALLAIMQDETGVCREPVPPARWNREPAVPAKSMGWMDEAWRLARFGIRGHHGVPAKSSDYLAYSIT